MPTISLVSYEKITKSVKRIPPPKYKGRIPFNLNTLSKQNSERDSGNGNPLLIDGANISSNFILIGANLKKPCFRWTSEQTCGRPPFIIKLHGKYAYVILSICVDSHTNFAQRNSFILVMFYSFGIVASTRAAQVRLKCVYGKKSFCSKHFENGM